MRKDSRDFDQIRDVVIERNVSPHAEGSVMISFGQTKVLVTASVEKDLPKWMENAEQGWITAEYGMLPRSTHTRNKREAGAGKQSGRTLEIQRLIGRSLRQSVNLKDIPGLSIKIDCDVIVADGGTRTTSINGASIALNDALIWAKEKGLIKNDVRFTPIAAISLGMVGSMALLDLCYEEDSSADFDLNIVCDENLGIVEIQGTGESCSISRDEYNSLLDLGLSGVKEVLEIQKQFL